MSRALLHPIDLALGTPGVISSTDPSGSSPTSGCPSGASWGGFRAGLLKPSLEMLLQRHDQDDRFKRVQAEPAAQGWHLLREVQPQHLPVPAGLVLGHVLAPLPCSGQLQVPAHGTALDRAFNDPTHAWRGGLDHPLKMHDLNTEPESLVGTHDAPTRCVEYCPEVNVMVTGSWGQTVKLRDPRIPCNAGTFSQRLETG